MINSFSCFTPLITAVRDGEQRKPGKLFPHARFDKSPSKQSRENNQKPDFHSPRSSFDSAAGSSLTAMPGYGVAIRQNNKHWRMSAPLSASLGCSPPGRDAPRANLQRVWERKSASIRLPEPSDVACPGLADGPEGLFYFVSSQQTIMSPLRFCHIFTSA